MYCCAVPLDEDDSMQLPAALLQDAGFLLAQAADREAAMLEEKLRPFGIKRRHYAVLVTLAENPGSSQQELADPLGIDRTTMAKITDDLEELGLVRRSRHPRSRRANAVKLTPGGSRALPHITRAVSKATEQLLAPLSGSKRDVLRRLLLEVANSPAAGRAGRPTR